MFYTAWSEYIIYWGSFLIHYRAWFEIYILCYTYMWHRSQQLPRTGLRSIRSHCRCLRNCNGMWFMYPGSIPIIEFPVKQHFFSFRFFDNSLSFSHIRLCPSINVRQYNVSRRCPAFHITAGTYTPHYPNNLTGLRRTRQRLYLRVSFPVF